MKYDKKIDLFDGQVMIIITYPINISSNFQSHVYIKNSLTENEAEEITRHLFSEIKLFANLNNIQFGVKDFPTFNYIDINKPLEEFTYLELLNHKEGLMLFEEYEKIPLVQYWIDKFDSIKTMCCC